MPAVLKVLLLLFALPFLVLGVALASMAVPLPAPFPEAFSQGRNLFSAVLTGVVGLVAVGGLGAYVVSLFLRAGRSLEGPLTGIGLRAEAHMGVGRRYSGSLKGHRVQVRVLPATYPEAGRVELEVAASGLPRIALGGSRPLLDCRDCPAVPITNVGLAQLQAYAEDPDDAAAALADPRVATAVTTLVAAHVANNDRELYLQPERAWLRVHARPQPTGEQAAQWLGRLVELVQALEDRAAGGPER